MTGQIQYKLCSQNTGSNHNNTICNFCKPGYHSVKQESGGYECEDCGIGSISTTGSTTCTQCEKGFGRNAAGDKCEECTAGTYSTAKGT